MKPVFRIHVSRVFLIVGAYVAQASSLALAVDPFALEIAHDMDRIERELADAESQSAQPKSGGMIMAIAHRLSVLQEAKALLERHRLTAMDRTVRSTARIEAEIEAKKIKESAARSRFYAARGGFVGVTSGLTLATIQDEIAVLELRRVQTRYGLSRQR